MSQLDSVNDGAQLTLRRFDTNNLGCPNQPKPTVIQLKGICACYNLKPVRKNSTRAELLRLLNEHNVQLSFYENVHQKKLKGAIVHHMQSTGSDGSESSDDGNRFENNVSDWCDSDEVNDDGSDRMDVDGDGELYGDYYPTSGDVVYEEEVEMESMDVSDDLV